MRSVIMLFTLLLNLQMISVSLNSKRTQQTKFSIIVNQFVNYQCVCGPKLGMILQDRFS